LRFLRYRKDSAFYCLVNPRNIFWVSWNFKSPLLVLDLFKSSWFIDIIQAYLLVCDWSLFFQTISLKVWYLFFYRKLAQTEINRDRLPWINLHQGMMGWGSLKRWSLLTDDERINIWPW
jgi:hypothetical protein